MKRAIKKQGFTFIISLLFYCHSFAQEMDLKGGFLTDSIRVGEVAPYSLSLEYPSQWEVLFPDSTYNFYPFEFVRKQYFPTRSVDGVSYDSAVYYLTTFELDERLPLALPVFLVEANDSSVLFAERDTLLLRQMIAELPDSLALKDTAFYRKVDTAVNYPYIFIGVIIILVVGALVVVFFGKSIMKRIRLYRLKKAHKRFIVRYDRLLSQMNGHARQAEQLVIEWKKYLEQLENKPFTKLTSREIIKNNPDGNLEKSLKGIDRSIYGGVEDEYLGRYLQHLADYSTHRYHRKVEEVKHEN